MNANLIFIALCLICVCISCATPAGRMNKISIGMTKAEVLDQMGDPYSTSAIENQEVLVYKLACPGWVTAYCTNEHWVILNNGKVTQFGKAGDFGSAAPATQKIIIQQEREPARR